jgi:hypothetical protein
MKRSMDDLPPHAKTSSRPVTSLRRLGLIACLLGSLAIPLGSGPALGRDVASGTPDPVAWSEWLQQHRELEYPMSPAVLAWPDTVTVTDWLQDHLRLEYPDSQGV